MSPEDKEMSESLLSSIWDQYLTGIAAARGKTKDEMAKNMDQDLTLPEKFAKAGMIDGEKYLDEIVKDLKGDKKGLAEVGEREYQSLPAEAQGINIGPRVAVIFGVGDIVNLEPGWSPFTESIMSAERTVKRIGRSCQG